MIFYYFLFTTLITFTAFAADKRLAVKHKRRISETILLTLVLIGGSLGAITAMSFFRHKTSKKSFIFKAVLIFGLQIVVLYYHWAINAKL